jgi:hypothetical protein
LNAHKEDVNGIQIPYSRSRLWKFNSLNKVASWQVYDKGRRPRRGADKRDIRLQGKRSLDIEVRHLEKLNNAETSAKTADIPGQ